MLFELEDTLRKEVKTKAIHRLGEIKEKECISVAESFAENLKQMCSIVDATLLKARTCCSIDAIDKEEIENLSRVYIQYKQPILAFLKNLNWDGNDFADFEELKNA